MESNDSPEIPDKGETSDIPGHPSEATVTTISHLPILLLLPNDAFKGMCHHLLAAIVAAPSLDCPLLLTGRPVAYGDCQR